jgi:hypothetical protein
MKTAHCNVSLVADPKSTTVRVRTLKEQGEVAKKKKKKKKRNDEGGEGETEYVGQK